MDWTRFCHQYVALIFMSYGVFSDQSYKVCDVDLNNYIEEGDWLQIHHLNVEEGILLQSRKLIGTVTLSGNATTYFAFDEPYFGKPRNLKSHPKPSHFEVIFTFVNSSNAFTPTGKPTTKPRVSSTSQQTVTAPRLSYVRRQADDFIGSGSGANITYFDHASSTTLHPYSTSISSISMNSTTKRVETSAAAVTFPTDEPETQCVKAYIYQIYDLDREEQDTYYLTITNLEEEAFMLTPVVVKINVTDKNDNSPVFVEDSLNTVIINDTTAGQVIAEIKAVDADIGIHADLRYSIPYSTVTRGNETGTSAFPTVIIDDTSGLVVLINSINDLSPPSKITFSVVVKDNGKHYVCNRATATATVSIIDSVSAKEITSAGKSTNRVGAIVAGSVAGGVLLLGLLIFVAVRCKRGRMLQRNGTLRFMMDDETLISA